MKSSYLVCLEGTLSFCIIFIFHLCVFLNIFLCLLADKSSCSSLSVDIIYT